jgi:hypothetical protein
MLFTKELSQIILRAAIFSSMELAPEATRIPKTNCLSSSVTNTTRKKGNLQQVVPL